MIFFRHWRGGIFFVKCATFSLLLNIGYFICKHAAYGHMFSDHVSQVEALNFYLCIDGGGGYFFMAIRGRRKCFTHI